MSAPAAYPITPAPHPPAPNVDPNSATTMAYQTALLNELRDHVLRWIDGFRHLRLLRAESAFGRTVAPASVGVRATPSTPLSRSPGESQAQPTDPMDNPYALSLVESFEWLHEYSFPSSVLGIAQRESIRHRYTIQFAFRGSNAAAETVSWDVRVLEAFGDGLPLQIQLDDRLASFTIPSSIYFTSFSTGTGDALPFAIDTDLVLEAIAGSLRERAPVYLESRVVYENGATGSAHILGGQFGVEIQRANTDEPLPRLHLLRVYELRVPLSRPSSPEPGGRAIRSNVVRLLGTRWLDAS